MREVICYPSQIDKDKYAQPKAKTDLETCSLPDKSCQDQE